MFDLIKKTMLAGVGLAVMTRDKAEAMAKEIAETAQLSADKGKAFVSEVVGQSEKVRQELEQTVQRVVDETLTRANVAKCDELEQLRSRVAELERQLETHNH